MSADLTVPVKHILCLSACRRPCKCEILFLPPVLQEREKHLADLLKTKLQRFVDGDKVGFKEQIQNEADRIAAIPFGVPMLETIG